MPSSLEPLSQLVAGALEAITPLSLGRSAKVELRAALTPIANRLEDALAQVPFACQDQQLLDLGEDVRKFGETTRKLESRLLSAQRRDLEELQNELDQFLLNASLAGYSEGFAVLSRVRQLRDGLM